MWDFIKDNILSWITLFLVFSVYTIVSEMYNVQNEIKKLIDVMLKDPKNIIIEDMKVLAGTFGSDEQGKKRIEKNKNWKIIGTISLFINALFILLIILDIIKK